MSEAAKAPAHTRRAGEAVGPCSDPAAKREHADASDSSSGAVGDATGDATGEQSGVNACVAKAGC